jgi:hypothetical protein
VYRDLPFAILRYDPREEWELRREAHHLATRLGNHGWKVSTISLGALLWEAIEATEGVQAIVDLEHSRGFEAAQEQVPTYLSDPDFRTLADLIAARLAPLDPKQYVAFLLRAAALAPSIYHMARLLDEMQGCTEVTTILFGFVAEIVTETNCR